MIDPILVDFLNEKVNQYERIDFIKDDPISIPHLFSKKEDIEIAGFLTATIAWGKRNSIMKNANRILDIMDRSPHEFILNHSESDLKNCDGFVHRTFNSDDLRFFFQALQNIYQNHGGLESVFFSKSNTDTFVEIIPRMRKIFFEKNDSHRSNKHISNPIKGSASKRLNMFLRWMVRSNSKGVDFGIWTKIKPAQLSIPLDVHTANVSRELGILTRKQNDAKAVLELRNVLMELDKNDPSKYDFALFGIGVNNDLDLGKTMIGVKNN